MSSRYEACTGCGSTLGYLHYLYYFKYINVQGLRSAVMSRLPVPYNDEYVVDYTVLVVYIKMVFFGSTE